MSHAAVALEVSRDQRAELEALSRSGAAPQRVARQARVLLLAAEGVANERTHRPRSPADETLPGRSARADAPVGSAGDRASAIHTPWNQPARGV